MLPPIFFWFWVVLGWLPSDPVILYLSWVLDVFPCSLLFLVFVCLFCLWMLLCFGMGGDCSGFYVIWDRWRAGVCCFDEVVDILGNLWFLCHLTWASVRKKGLILIGMCLFLYILLCWPLFTYVGFGVGCCGVDSSLVVWLVFACWRG